MQSDRNDHLEGIRSASEELVDNDGPEGEIEKQSDESGDETAPAESLDDDDDYSENWDGSGTVGEWQDWRCQQAIEKMPGVSPLCNACEYFFGEFQPFDTRYARVWEASGGISKTSLWLRFLAKLQVLQSSARNGCTFCKLIFASIKEESPGFEPAETVKIRVQVAVVQEPLPDLSFSYLGCNSPRSTVARSDSKSLCLNDGIRIGLSNMFYLYKLTALRQTT